MGFFSDFLTWLKGRNLCPSLMNDKQELEKLGEYEEEHPLTGQLYQHQVWVDVQGENKGFQFLYYAVNTISDKYASITTGSNIAVPDFNYDLIKQGFVYVKGSTQTGWNFAAWIANTQENETNVFTWTLCTTGRFENATTERLTAANFTVASNEAGQSVAIRETVTPFNPQ